MSISKVLISNTELDIESIKDILFRGMVVKEHEKSDVMFEVNGLRCQIIHPISDEFRHLAILQPPENLEVSFAFGSQITDFKTAMKITMNWFRHTEDDAMYLVGSEFVLLSRVNGHVTRTNSDRVDFPDVIIDLIDIPHDVKDLGIL